jgi:hypothetical protein
MEIFPNYMPSFPAFLKLLIQLSEPKGHKKPLQSTRHISGSIRFATRFKDELHEER